jgi:hypothetical protein
VQTQIEQALYLQLGEQVSWPELVREAGTALPVVMMDGFDELLQVNGQNWADCREELREFQQVVNWSRQALLWMAQLDYEDARRLWQHLRVRWDLDAEPTRLLIQVEDDSDVSVLESIPWPAEARPPTVDRTIRVARDTAMPADSVTGRALRKSAFVQTGFEARELIYTLIPFWRRLGDPTFVARGVTNESDARLLMVLALMRLAPTSWPRPARSDRLTLTGSP